MKKKNDKRLTTGTERCNPHNPNPNNQKHAFLAINLQIERMELYWTKVKNIQYTTSTVV